MMDRHRHSLAASDPAIHAALLGEEERQRDGIELIPSENYTYPEVLALLGSAIRAGATTAATDTPTRSRRWRAIAPAHCFAPNTPTCSRCQDRR
jgi:hypothetical protein